MYRALASQLGLRLILRLRLIEVLVLGKQEKYHVLEDDQNYEGVASKVVFVKQGAVVQHRQRLWVRSLGPALVFGYGLGWGLDCGSGWGRGLGLRHIIVVGLLGI